MKNMIKAMLFVMLTALSAAKASAQVASNPPYVLEQSVIAGGGGGGTSTDAGNQFSIVGTIGQAIVDASSGAPYSVKSGFFTPAAPLAPTAGEVTVGGRAISATGRGIRNILITLTDASGNSRTVLTSDLGRYQFTEVAAGETYILTARGKRYTFTQSSQAVNINEDTNDINFIGNNDNR